MSGPVTKSLVYDKWDGGEFGTLSPMRAPNGTWTGSNVVVYRNGRIGPRPGLKKITVDNPAEDGPLLGLGFSPVTQAGNTSIFYICDNEVYLFEPGTTTLYNTVTDLSTTPANTDATKVLSKESVRLVGDDVYFALNSDQTYKLNCRTQTLTAIAGSPEGTDVEMYRDRMMVADGSVRVRFSAAADFTTWDSGNFFDVGATWRIVNMQEFRDALVIFTLSGTWVFTGSPDDGTLRRISDTLAPLDKSVVKTNDELIYIPLSRSAPVIYNGSYGDEEALAHLETWKASGGSAYGVQSYGNRDVVFVAGTGAKALWRKNGAWSYHTFNVSGIGPWVTRYFDDNIVVAHPGSAGVKPTFYMLAMNLNRPAFTSDTWARPGDDSSTPLTASVTLPDHMTETGKELRVRSVTVEFYKYDTGSGTNNNIDISVTSLSRENLDGDQTTTKTGLFNESGALANTSGVFCRRIYRGTPQSFGGGYRISLDNLKGVAIERVIVDVEERDVPVQ